MLTNPLTLCYSVYGYRLSVFSYKRTLLDENLLTYDQKGFHRKPEPTTDNYKWRKTMPLKTLEQLVAEAKANVGHISPDELTESTESIIL